MLPAIRNLFDNTAESADEVIHRLLEGSNFRLDQIVSCGAHSPSDFWYDQEGAEWVALIKGKATLEFEEGLLALRAGDSLVIPAHVKHRVAKATADAVWLALHYMEDTERVK
jgi:cupin 2 domain-containing protein